jgi:hypothetical protein
VSSRALFGPPQRTAAKGGLQVTVHLVPVFEGRLVAFDVSSGEVRGRWLPWAVIDYRQNPYEAAALLADDWLDAALHSLRVVDVMSLEGPLGGWELAIVFRAEMEELPAGDGDRVPYPYRAGEFDAIGSFDPADLERWVGGAEALQEPGAPGAIAIF